MAAFFLFFCSSKTAPAISQDMSGVTSRAELQYQTHPVTEVALFLKESSRVILILDSSL